MSAKSKGFVLGVVVGFALNHVVMRQMTKGA